MSGVLERAAGFFLAPAGAEPRVHGAAVSPAIRAVVLGRRPDAVPLAAALALSLRVAGRARTAVVAVWSCEQPDPCARPDAGAPHRSSMHFVPPDHAHAPLRSTIAASGEQAERNAGGDERHGEPPGEHGRRGRATRAAIGLAGRLSARGMAAAPRGRLVWLAVPEEVPAATAAVRRASSLVEGPLVTALSGPRPAQLDDLVAEHDIAVVAADPATPLARAALASLTDRGVVASAQPPLTRGPRLLALAGLTAPRFDTPQLAFGRRERDR